MTLRIPILLLIVGLVALWYCHPVPLPAAPRILTPAEIVAHEERRYGLPPGSLDGIWSVECSRQEVGGAACRNHKRERGAFQMLPAAAKDAGCQWSALGTGNFQYEAECGASYLRLWLDRCGDIHRAQGAYHSGHCTDTSIYVRKVASR